MASVTPSALISEIRGKIGDQFFSRNAHGPFVGQWSTPTNPNSTGQQLVRDAMATGVVAWRNTSDNEKKVWYDWAADQINALSISRKPSRVAYNEFVGRYVSRAVVSGSNTNINPYAIKPVLLSFKVSATSLGSLVISYELPSSSVGAILVVSATNATSAGVRLPTQPAFRAIETVTTTNTTDTIDVFASLNSKWTIDASNVGEKVHLCGWLIDANDYTKSQTLFTSVVIDSDLYTVPPSITQSSTAQGTAVSNLTISFPSTPSPGELILLYFWCPNNNAINAPSGFTTIGNNSITVGRVICFGKIASGSESNSYNSTGTGSINRAAIGICVKNVLNISKAINITAAAISPPVTSFAAQTANYSFTTNSLGLAGMGWGAAVSATSINNSYTLVQSVNHSGEGGIILELYYRIYTAGASVNPTVSWTTGRSAIGSAQTVTL